MAFSNVGKYYHELCKKKKIKLAVNFTVHIGTAFSTNNQNPVDSDPSLFFSIRQIIIVLFSNRAETGDEERTGTLNFPGHLCNAMCLIFCTCIVLQVSNFLFGFLHKSLKFRVCFIFDLTHEQFLSVSTCVLIIPYLKNSILLARDQK